MQETHLMIERLFMHICVCVCVICTGHRPPAAGLGDHTRLEYQLEHLEGGSVCYTADGEHGEHSTGNVQKSPQTPERTKGQFHRTDPGSLSQCDMHG